MDNTWGRVSIVQCPINQISAVTFNFFFFRMCSFWNKACKGKDVRTLRYQVVRRAANLSFFRLKRATLPFILNPSLDTVQHFLHDCFVVDSKKLCEFSSPTSPHLEVIRFRFGTLVSHEICS